MNNRIQKLGNLSSEELNNLINRGDAEALVAMGWNCYRQNPSGQALATAIDWFEKAALTGNPGGLCSYITGKTLKAQLQTMFAAQTGADRIYQLASEWWHDVATWAYKMQVTSRKGTHKKFAAEAYINACYNECVCLIILDKLNDTQRSYEMAYRFSDPCFNILKGVSIPISIIDQVLDNLEQLYVLLQSIETQKYKKRARTLKHLTAEMDIYFDPKMTDLIRDISPAERIVIAYGAERISAYYRAEKNSPQKALSMLKKTAKDMDEGVGKNILLEEIQHYKKGLFGRYKYIE